MLEVMHSIPSSGGVTQQRNGSAYRRVQLYKAALFDTRVGPSMLCDSMVRCNSFRQSPIAGAQLPAVLGNDRLNRRSDLIERILHLQLASDNQIPDRPSRLGHLRRRW